MTQAISLNGIECVERALKSAGDVAQRLQETPVITSIDVVAAVASGQHQGQHAT